MNSAFDMPTIFAPPPGLEGFNAGGRGFVYEDKENENADPAPRKNNKMPQRVLGDNSCRNPGAYVQNDASRAPLSDSKWNATAGHGKQSCGMWGSTADNGFSAGSSKNDEAMAPVPQYLTTAWKPSSKEPAPQCTWRDEKSKACEQRNSQRPKYRKPRWDQSWPSRTVRKRFESLLLHYLDPFTIQHNRYLRKNETVPFFSLEFLAGLTRFKHTYEDLPLETQIRLFKFACEQSKGRLCFVEPDRVKVTSALELRTFTKSPSVSLDAVNFIIAKMEERQHRPNGHFSVMSYCVSSDLSQASHFPKETDERQSELLSWGHRRGLLRRQMAAYGSEIMTLQGVQSTNSSWVAEDQEADASHELDHLRYLLATMPNYACAYNPVIPCPRTGEWSFGCAVMWNNEIFRLVSVAYTDSGLIVDLTLIETGKTIRVTSSKSISTYNMEWGHDAKECTPVDTVAGEHILCGDFGLNPDEKVNMKNAVTELCNNMEWTSFSAERPSTDRIFYNGQLQAVACLGGHSASFLDSLDADDVMRFFPSDHIPQVVVFSTLS